MEDQAEKMEIYQMEMGVRIKEIKDNLRIILRDCIPIMDEEIPKQQIAIDALRRVKKAIERAEKIVCQDAVENGHDMPNLD